MRFTVRLDDADAAWVEREADDRDRSKASVIEQAVRGARGVDSIYAVRGGADRTGADRTGQTQELLKTLETRLERLEERVETVAEEGAQRGAQKRESAARGDASLEPGNRSDSEERERSGGEHSLTLTESDRRELLNTVPGRGRERREQRVDDVLEVASYLRDQRVAAKSDVLADVWDGLRAGYSDPESWWTGTVRPGLHQLATTHPIKPPTAGEPWRWCGER